MLDGGRGIMHAEQHDVVLQEGVRFNDGRNSLSIKTQQHLAIDLPVIGQVCDILTEVL